MNIHYYEKSTYEIPISAPESSTIETPKSLNCISYLAFYMGINGKEMFKECS